MNSGVTCRQRIVKVGRARQAQASLRAICERLWCMGIVALYARMLIFLPNSFCFALLLGLSPPCRRERLPESVFVIYPDVTLCGNPQRLARRAFQKRNGCARFKHVGLKLIRAVRMAQAPR